MMIAVLRILMRSFRRCERGTSAVEFAILAPVMIFLAIGMIDVGRYTYYAILAANAARAGAQYGAQDLAHLAQTTPIQNAATADGAGLAWQFSPAPACKISINGGAMSPCPSGGSTPATGTVYYMQVNVSGTFNTLVPYPGIGKTITVSGSSTMRVANQ
jgi:Flp pilus assembly protein TadG